MLSPTLTFEMEEARGQPRPDHWSRIWPTAVALSCWLLAQPEGSLPRSAKELGCGVGLVSMTLAHLGIVTEGTDRNRTALALAVANSRRNSLCGFTAGHLEWSEPHGDSSSFLVGSDITYDASAPDALYKLVQEEGRLLPGGRLLLGGPHRRRELLDDLTRMLEDQGYTHEEETVPVDSADPAARSPGL